MPCHIAFESTTFPLSNGIINYMIAIEIIKFFYYLKMVPDKLYFRHCMLYEFHSKQKNATRATNSIRFVYKYIYGDLALDVRI